MAKKKRETSMAMPKPPSLTDQLKWSAESMGRTVVENHPKVKKLRDGISRAVMGAAKQALKDSARKGSFGA